MSDLVKSFVAIVGDAVEWLGSPESAVRWAAEHGLSTGVVWLLDPVAGTSEQVMMHRAEDVWVFVAGDGRELERVGHPLEEDRDERQVVETIERLARGSLPMVKISLAAWPEDSDSYRRFGFSHPLSAHGHWWAEFCPQIVARQCLAASVAAQDRAHYLASMYLRLLLHIEHMDTHPEQIDVAERDAIIDESLWERSPDALQIVARVHFAALDDERNP